MQSSSVVPKVTFIFDFDGTLADTFPMFKSIALQIADEYGLNKSEAENLDELRDLGTIKLMKRLGVSLAQLPRFAKRSQEIMNSQLDQIKIMPNMKQVLLGLKERGITLGVLSSNSEDNVRAVLKKGGVEPYFDFIKCGSSLFGKTKKINDCIKEYGLTKEYTYYFGDETRDIEGANGAGVVSVGVTWGFNSAKALKLYKPSHILTSVEQILQLV